MADAPQAVDSGETRDELSRINTGTRDTIEMSVTVDVSDMDAESTSILHELAEMYEDGFTEVVEKNRDYSWSFLETGRKLAESDGVPFDRPSRCQAFGLLTRCGDKRERLLENVYGDGDAAVSDDPSVTAQEAANYYMLLAYVLANPESSDGNLVA